MRWAFWRKKKKAPPEQVWAHVHDPLTMDDIPANIRVRYALLSKAMVDQDMSTIIQVQTGLCRGRWLVADRLSTVRRILDRHPQP